MPRYKTPIDRPKALGNCTVPQWHDFGPYITVVFRDGGGWDQIDGPGFPRGILIPEKTYAKVMNAGLNYAHEHGRVEGIKECDDILRIHLSPRHDIAARATLEWLDRVLRSRQNLAGDREPTLLDYLQEDRK